MHYTQVWDIAAKLKKGEGFTFSMNDIWRAAACQLDSLSLDRVRRSDVLEFIKNVENEFSVIFTENPATLSWGMRCRVDHEKTYIQPSEVFKMLDQEIESEVQAKGLNAPRVTLADLEANIAEVEYVKHVSAGGKILRWAVITTKNGFAVTGKPSAAVSIENDNQEIGEKVAFDNSKSELWALMGYALADRLM